MIDIIFPILPWYDENPVWTGHDFKKGSNHLSVLCYSETLAGWNCDLTDFHEINASEENHYIVKAPRLYACNEIKKYLPEKGFILEIGYSSGYLIQDLINILPNVSIIGSDCFSERLNNISENFKIPLLQFDPVHCPLSDSCVDVVVALIVLEHIEDGGSALYQICCTLKSGGYAVIEVPANQDLYDFYDRELGHFRGYNTSELSDKLERNGFEIDSHSHPGFFIYPTFRAIKFKNKGLSSPDNRKLIESQVKTHFIAN